MLSLCAFAMDAFEDPPRILWIENFGVKTFAVYTRYYDTISFLFWQTMSIQILNKNVL